MVYHIPLNPKMLIFQRIDPFEQFILAFFSNINTIGLVEYIVQHFLVNFLLFKQI